MTLINQLQLLQYPCMCDLKVKLLMYQSSTTVRTNRLNSDLRLQIQEAERSFLCRVSGFTPRDGVRGAQTSTKGLNHCFCKSNGVSCGGWSDKDTSWTPPCGDIQGGVFGADKEKQWRNYRSHLVWECIEIPQEELEGVGRAAYRLTAYIFHQDLKVPTKKTDIGTEVGF